MGILQKRFQENLLAMLDARGMTKAELARKMKVDGPYVYVYLSGKSSPGLDVVERFAKALNCDPSELLTAEYVAA